MENGLMVKSMENSKTCLVSNISVIKMQFIIDFIKSNRNKRVRMLSYAGKKSGSSSQKKCKGSGRVKEAQG